MKHSFEVKTCRCKIITWLVMQASFLRQNSFNFLTPASHTGLIFFFFTVLGHWIADTSVAILLKINFAWFFMLSGILSLYPG
ncbi:IS putative transposase [Escherichia coli]|uniref:IS putative transposase n=1 Tax=Escherichia coli TaxID=562 RepID=A0A376MPN6_ECOLX|nr:IS putative transposase [Escherichia coli]